jgi:two-component system cell cycle sensor histidine kinase/response regulator CckA
MRSVTRQHLQEHGYTVIEASDGKSALQWAEAHPGRTDLLLTDVVMRGMSGPELVEHLNGSHPNLKVVYMSGYTGELIGERGRLKGGPLLEKPFTRAALLNAIHTILG